MFVFTLAVLLVAQQPTPDISPTLSPTPMASSTPAASPATSGKQRLTLDIPPGWLRTETGQYNQWNSPDGKSDFRVAVTGVTSDLQGPNAAASVKAMFTMLHPNKPVEVKTVQVCNGTQPAYRVDDPLGTGSPAFMMLIPGTKSSGLINYEILPGGKADPAILAAVDKICWP